MLVRCTDDIVFYHPENNNYKLHSDVDSDVDWSSINFFNDTGQVHNPRQAYDHFLNNSHYPYNKYDNTQDEHLHVHINI